MMWVLTILQALGYVHGADIVHAPEPVHGRLRYVQKTCSISDNREYIVLVGTESHLSDFS